MPNLTLLTRDQDICVARWQNPNGKEVTDYILTPITPTEIESWLNGADPPRAPGVPNDWVHKNSELQRMYTNGNQAIGDNEIGDTGCWDAEEVKSVLVKRDGTASSLSRFRYFRPAPTYRAVIKEPGETPVIVDMGSGDVDKLGQVITTKKDMESIIPNKAGKIPTYRIVNNVATKVSEK